MNFNRSNRFAAGCILLGLMLVHLYPGGLTLCVKADGSRAVEFGCGCGHVQLVADSCSCCVHHPAAPSGHQLASTSNCSGCSDFELEMRLGPAPELPAVMVLLAVIAPAYDLRSNTAVPKEPVQVFSNLPPPPLLAELHQPTVVIRV